MARILCWLIPIHTDAGAHPEHPIFYPPPPVDPGYGVPAPPNHIWGPTDPRPTPPIYWPGFPGGGGGGTQPPSGAHPEHPIYYPPGPVDPGYGVPGPPPHIWGPTDPRPTPPIYWPGYPGGGGGGTQPPGGAHPEHPIYYPPHIWGPTDPRPNPPIANVPGAPGYQPPSGGVPSHPILEPAPPGKVWAYVNIPGGKNGWILIDDPTALVPTPPMTETPPGQTWIYVKIPTKGDGWVCVTLPPELQPPPATPTGKAT